MIRYLIIIILISSITEVAFTQMHDNVWTLGYTCIPGDSSRFGGTNISFFDGEASTSYHCRNLRFRNNHTASISDSLGNLLMMFNGCTLTDAHDNIVIGNELLVRNDSNIEQTWWCIDGYNTPHGSFFLPDPYDDEKYYLFYRDIIGLDEQPYVISDSLYSATIMLDENIPQVIEKKSILSDTVSIVGFSAMKHSNGKDWWIISKDRYTNLYHKHLLNDAGVNLYSSQKIGTEEFAINGGNTTRFSPDGQYFVVLYPFGNLDIFTFDRTSGEFTEYLSIPFWADPTNSLVINTEFSPSGEFLYVADIDTLWQFDMSVPKEDFWESKITVGIYDGFSDPFPTNFWLMQAAPNGKIYMSARNSSKFLHVIHEPNKKGLECVFRQHDFELSTVNAFALPYFPNFRLGPDSTNVNTENIPLESKMTIYPNPATNKINIASSQTFDEIQIFDMNLRLIKKETTNEFMVDDLRPGIYIVKSYLENKFLSSSKFVVIK